MEAHEVAPDVVDVAPADVIKVKYGDLEVNMGNVLKPSQVKNAPTSISWPVEEGAFYTLLMTDPDAPSRHHPKFHEWHHWLVVNIPGCDVSEGEVKLDYVGSGPPKGTKLHRYIFLAYKQPGKITYTDVVVCSKPGFERGSRKARDLSSKYNLGNPVAGNLFQAEHEC
ncbi:unnamed protein product [Porites evermanni]|uniref:Phosphatidylethanolamine-binding protein n=1 Tax=Porites evermanni TaxID=104178 RepID=A0ABN8MJB3_9CNID|nr:unnamed protein product [Porites evermanni]